jgi:hypothetical protein
MKESLVDVKKKTVSNLRFNQKTSDVQFANDFKLLEFYPRG